MLAGRPARADPAARDGDRRRALPRARSPASRRRACSTSASGTGAIALAIADEHPGARVTGIDGSADALALARENVDRTGLAVELLEHDLFDGLPPGPWDLVVSNPPYVRPGEVESLAPEVRDWEPRMALVAERCDGGGRAGCAVTCSSPEARSCSRSPTATRHRVAGAAPRARVRGRRDHARPDRARARRRGSGRRMSEVDEAVGRDPGGRARRPPDRHRVRARVHALSRGAREDGSPPSRGAPATQPMALVAASVDALLELRARAATGRAAVLAGRSCRARTRSCCPNPARRFRVAHAGAADAIGVRVPRAARRRRLPSSTRSAPSPRRARTCPAAAIHAGWTRCRGDPRRGAGARRRRAPGDAVDGDRPHRPPSPACSREGAVARGERAGAASRPPSRE